MAHVVRLGIRLTRGGAVGSFAVLLSCLTWLAPTVSLGTPVGVAGIRHFSAPEHTRIVLDLDGPASFEVRRVQNPDRIAINIRGAVFGLELQAPAACAARQAEEAWDELVRGIRIHQSVDRAQVVVDLEQRAEFRSFSLPATGGRPDRVVVDVLRPGGAPSPAAAPAPAAAASTRPFTVVIDPGHGGLDPGATRDGVDEKAVVLDIGREMARLVNAVPGYRAELTRTGDYGLELWQRVEFARRQGGDLFLSIHCNTNPSPDVAGMEVYFLSLQRASDSQAQELADQENAAHLVGLDPGRGHDSMVIDILLDLKKTQILKDSAALAGQVLAAGQASGVVGGRAVKQAGFQVLKNLAMPSALVEVAYMSNRGDMAVLLDRQGRKDLAAAVVTGIMAWQQDQPAIAQLAGGQGAPWTGEYQVRRGDSLWGLARQHGTTVTEISRHNNLESGSISVGQRLRLPEVGQEP